MNLKSNVASMALLIMLASLWACDISLEKPIAYRDALSPFYPGNMSVSYQLTSPLEQNVVTVSLSNCSLIDQEQLELEGLANNIALVLFTRFPEENNRVIVKLIKDESFIYTFEYTKRQIEDMLAYYPLLKAYASGQAVKGEDQVIVTDDGSTPDLSPEVAVMASHLEGDRLDQTPNAYLGLAPILSVQAEGGDGTGSYILHVRNTAEDTSQTMQFAE